MTTTIAKRQNGKSSVSFGNVVDNIFQHSLRRFFDDNFQDADQPMRAGTVPVNVRETEHHYEMDVIAPGCRKEDFSIRVEDNMLTVSFEHKDENRQEDQKTGWVRNEYRQQSFKRSFTVDDTVDMANINATYRDGVLRLVLPKNEKAKALSRSIEVK